MHFGPASLTSVCSLKVNSVGPTLLQFVSLLWTSYVTAITTAIIPARKPCVDIKGALP